MASVHVFRNWAKLTDKGYLVGVHAIIATSVWRCCAWFKIVLDGTGIFTFCLPLESESRNLRIIFSFLFLVFSTAPTVTGFNSLGCPGNFVSLLIKCDNSDQ